MAVAVVTDDADASLQLRYFGLRTKIDPLSRRQQPEEKKLGDFVLWIFDR